MRQSVLGVLAGQVFRQIFSGADFMSPIFVPPHIYKSTKSFMVITVPHD